MEVHNHSLTIDIICKRITQLTMN